MARWRPTATDGVDPSHSDALTPTLDALLAAVAPRGHLAVMAHLDREADARAGELGATLAQDLPVPDRPYSFGRLQAAQAAGDRQALADRQRPLLHLHLTDRSAGTDQVLGALT